MGEGGSQLGIARAVMGLALFCFLPARIAALLANSTLTHRHVIVVHKVHPHRGV
jgi:hypothetical protein